MIKQYRITLVPENVSSLSIDSGYQFYAVLLELLNPEYAELIHGNGISPINQHVIIQKELKTLIWTINLLGEQACEQLASVLEKTNSYLVKKSDTKLMVKDINMSVVPTDMALIERAHEMVDLQRPAMEFLTPASFKIDGQYQIFPSVEEIIKNLAHRWNCYSESYLIEDKDAVKSLIDGIKIAGYDLHSSYYSMKGIKIPAFKGEIRFNKKLSVPMAELLHLLLLFSEYCGVGIKTSLGMGAVKIRYSR